jgi:hypothetical protein
VRIGGRPVHPVAIQRLAFKQVEDLGLGLRRGHLDRAWGIGHGAGRQQHEHQRADATHSLANLHATFPCR